MSDQSRIETLEKWVANRDATIATLRKILSECASAIGNGSFADETCSIEFLQKIPGEMARVNSLLRADLAKREAVPVNDSLTTALAVSDGWIKHNGGPCPVQKDVLIDFKKRNGREYLGVPAYPNGGDWTYTEKSIGDESIVAWRLAAENEEKQA